MKPSISIVVAFNIALLVAPGARAEWTLQQGNGDQGTVYLSIGAGSESLAAAVGFSGSTGSTQAMYARTTDGETWTAGGFTQFASAVAFVDETLGYAGGLVGKVWETTDGGASWVEVPSAVIGGTLMDGETIADIAVSKDGGTVWIIGATGRCSYTVDDGETWTRVDVPLPAGDELSVTAGWIVGETIWLVGGKSMTEPTEGSDFEDETPGNSASSGFVLRSDDGGETFSTIASGLELELTDVSFVNPDEGWAAAATYTEGGAAVGVSTDGGETWDFVSMPDLAESEVAFSGMGASTVLGACKRVRFFGRLVGVASCTTRTYDADGTNALLLTEDGGETWQHQTGYKDALPNQLMAALQIVDIGFADCHRGWLVGEGKLIVRWDNDDSSLDCEAGGAPGEETQADGGEENNASEGCDCATTGVNFRARGKLLQALLEIAFGLGSERNRL